MGLITQIQRGRTATPPRILVYGTEGIGKSTLAARAPQPVFVQTEDGLGEIDCDKFPLAASFADTLAALAELREQEHSYQTVVVDSLDWLERLIWDAVCQDYGVKSIEKVDGGYGKGYIYALSYWRQFIERLVALHTGRCMAVILIAHAKVEKFEDPEASPYDRYSPRLHKHAGALISASKRWPAIVPQTQVPPPESRRVVLVIWRSWPRSNSKGSFVGFAFIVRAPWLKVGFVIARPHMSHAGLNTSSAAGPIPAGIQQVFPAEFTRFCLATTWQFTKDRHMSGDSPQLNPAALTVAQVAQVLSAAGGRSVTIAMVERDLADGAPTNANGTVNLVMYAAWLQKDRASAN